MCVLRWEGPKKHLAGAERPADRCLCLTGHAQFTDPFACRIALYKIQYNARFSSRASREAEARQRALTASYPGADAPLPSGLAVLFAINVPYVAERVWAVVKHWMLSKNDRDRFQIFRKDQRGDFERELLRHVDARHVPARYGGTAPDCALASGRMVVPASI